MATYGGGYFTDEDDFDDDDTLESMVLTFNQVTIKEKACIFSKPEQTNDLLTMENIQLASCAVCEIYTVDLTRGGGFLGKFYTDKSISKYGLFTANHVLPEEMLALGKFKLKFSIFNPKAGKTEDVELNINGTEYYYTKKDPIDATFILIDKKQRDECKKKGLCFLLVGGTFKLNKMPTVYMIHNPKEMAKTKQTCAHGKYIKKKGRDIQYTVSTVKGSSGSPIIREDGKVVAIHKEGGNGYYNTGIAIEEIIKEIKGVLNNSF